MGVLVLLRANLRRIEQKATKGEKAVCGWQAMMSLQSLMSLPSLTPVTLAARMSGEAALPGLADDKACDKARDKGNL